MDKAKFDEYLEERYAKKIAWYNAKSILNKRLYVGFQWAVIILSACIPVLTVSISDTYKWLTAGLGVFLAIGTAGLKTFKFQENWLNYRTVAEMLKQECYYYDGRIPIFPVKGKAPVVTKLSASLILPLCRKKSSWSREYEHRSGESRVC
jgi:uncharacterized protein DUF4231